MLLNSVYFGFAYSTICRRRLTFAKVGKKQELTKIKNRVAREKTAHTLP
jgi:hypothetical protein